MNEALVHSLQRTIVIAAQKTTVFRFFTDSQRFARWWGAGSTIQGEIGGLVQIRHPNGVLVSGEVLEINPPDRIVFTYGYESGKPIPPGSSRITIHLQDHPEGTELTLLHDFSEATIRDSHIQGWRYQLALFSNVASSDEHSNVQDLIDAYFELWNTKEANVRLERMNRLLDPAIRFQDCYSCTSGLEDLAPHLAAVHLFMPGLTIARNGNVQECQGTAIARWITTRADGSQTAKGINVFTLTPAGKISRIVGFWE